MTKQLGFTGKLSEAARARLLGEGHGLYTDPDLFADHLKRTGAAHPKLTQPDMGKLRKKARAVRFDRDETYPLGPFPLGKWVTVKLVDEPNVQAQVWSLAPDGGVWLATTDQRFLWAHRSHKTVKRPLRYGLSGVVGTAA